MKKFILIAFVGLGLAFSTTSCKKCKDCSYTAYGQTVSAGNLCGDALDAAEASGYDCK